MNKTDIEKVNNNSEKDVKLIRLGQVSDSIKNESTRERSESSVIVDDTKSKCAKKFFCRPKVGPK